MKRRHSSRRTPARKPAAHRAVVIGLALAGAAGVIAWAKWGRGDRTISPAASNIPAMSATGVVASALPGGIDLLAATNDVASLVGDGNLLLQRGDAAGAVKLYQQALQLDANDEDVWFNLGLAHARAGNRDEAIRCQREALRLLPEYVEAHNALGSVFLALGRHAEAMEHYSAALKIRPEDSVTLNHVGHCLAVQGDTKQAAGRFAEAVRQNPDYFEAQFNLATAQLKLGNLDEAIGDFEQALKMRPDFAPARQGLERARAAKAAPAGTPDK